MREAGYYHVVLDGRKSIAQWCEVEYFAGKDYFWFLPGSMAYHYDENFDKIGPKINEPEELG